MFYSAAVDFDESPEEAAFRAEARAWLASASICACVWSDSIAATCDSCVSRGSSGMFAGLMRSLDQGAQAPATISVRGDTFSFTSAAEHITYAALHGLCLDGASTPDELVGAIEALGIDPERVNPQRA